MAETQQTPEERVNYISEHLRIYLETDGEQGHVLDLTGKEPGAGPNTTTLLLQTIGRKSGRVLTVPLIYDKVGEEFVIIASKGGAEQHPAWYLNLVERPEVRFQVGRNKYQGTWRVIEGKERGPVWEQLAEFYPPYHAYQKRTDRIIPVIALKPVEKIDAL